MIKEMIVKSCELVVCVVKMGDKPDLVLPQIRMRGRYFSTTDFDIDSDDAVKFLDVIYFYTRLFKGHDWEYRVWKNESFALPQEIVDIIVNFDNFDEFRDKVLWGDAYFELNKKDGTVFDVEKADYICDSKDNEYSKVFIRLRMQWFKENLKGGDVLASKLIENILGAGKNGIELDDIFNILKKHDVPKENYIDFVNLMIGEANVPDNK